MFCNVVEDDFLKLQELWKQPIESVLTHISYTVSKNNLKKT